MRAVVQRVLNASVSVENIVKGKIDNGFLVYLGVAHNDNNTDADWLAEKIPNLRIFDDNDGKMNLSLKDLLSEGLNVGVLAISQFTLMGETRKGRRPSWDMAAQPEKAKQLYKYFIEAIKNQQIKCESGEFQAHMMVSYTNDGPVTIILDTKIT
ncbi:MAG: D-aminoacyl-tRNA deacylase [Treponema sp.]|nr:D-aminoacyl-tRNA deacylase [Treponema sp.]